jgi:hypothetical protein
MPTRRKPPFKGLLRKPIHLDDAPWNGIAHALGLEPGLEERVSFVLDETEKRLLKLDELFGLKSARPDIWEQRAKAIIAGKFDIPADSPNWWVLFSYHLLQQHVPGFRVRQPGKRRAGTPRVWTMERLAELFADIEYLKREKGMRVRSICALLPKARGYSRRWGTWSAASLRKAYGDAVQLRQSSMLFNMVLYGPGVKPDGATIEAAIKAHAMRTDVPKSPR